MPKKEIITITESDKSPGLVNKNKSKDNNLEHFLPIIPKKPGQTGNSSVVTEKNKSSNGRVVKPVAINQKNTKKSRVWMIK